MERIIPSKFGRRSLTALNHWEELPFGQFKITRPTIVCFGGDKTCDRPGPNGKIITGSEQINGFCALGERLMGLRDENVDKYSTYHNLDFLGFSYGKDNPLSHTGFLTDEEKNIIVENLFLPLFFNENGERLSLEECKKNFSLITFLTHCHGAKELASILSKTNNYLIKNGFSQEETLAIFRESSQISYSPATDETWVPTIRFYSFEDAIFKGMDKLYFDAYKEHLNGVSLKYDSAGFLRNEQKFYCHQEILTIYSSRLLNNPIENEQVLYDEHSLVHIDRDFNWNIKNTTAKNADTVSKILSYSLSKMVANSVQNYYSDSFIAKPNIIDVLPELEDVLSVANAEELSY